MPLDRHPALAQIARIGACLDESDVDAIVRPLLRDAFVDQYLFLMIHKTKLSEEPVRYALMGGCSPSLLTSYWGRHWFVNDPYVQHVLTSACPITGSQLKSLSDGQNAMLKNDRREGLQSCLAVSARGANTIAVLRVGNGVLPQEGGEERLAEHTVLFIALANVLLIKHLGLLRKRAAKRFDLDDKEISILELVYGEHSASVVAARLGISTHTVHKAYRSISAKMKVRNVREAMAKAVFAGLVD